MADTTSICALRALTSSLISDTLKKIRSGRQHSPSQKEQHFRTAIYFLLEAKPYVDGAWEMLSSGNVRGAFALCRWVLEAAMNLWWVVADQDEIEQRLKDLAGEALRNETKLRADLAKLYAQHATALQAGTDTAKKVMNELGVDRLQDLCSRIKSVKPPNRPDWPDLYVLYRICCLASHPGLRVWWRFRMVGSATVSSEPIDNQIFTTELACWMVAAGTLCLTCDCLCLSGTEDMEALKDWWSKKVEPRLPRHG